MHYCIQLHSARGTTGALAPQGGQGAQRKARREPRPACGTPRVPVWGIP